MAKNEVLYQNSGLDSVCQNLYFIQVGGARAGDIDPAGILKWRLLTPRTN